jgi:hypothetical protein
MKNVKTVLLTCAALGIGSALIATAQSPAPPAQQPAAPADNGTGPNGLAGFQGPPPIPGYEPSTDPKDFRGVWRYRAPPGLARFKLAPDVKLNARARQQIETRAAKLAAKKGTTIATPHVMCRPTGLNQALMPIAPIYILQDDEKLVFIVTDEIRDVRQVYLKRKHPKDLEPSYGGDSVGHWEGNTLVIDTIGYNGRGDLHGAVHSKKMHLEQRFTKSADGRTLVIESTFDDPETLAEPVHVRKEWGWLNGQQPLEFDCEENPREDNFSGMLFEEDYLKPVCIQHEGRGMEPSRVACTPPK